MRRVRTEIAGCGQSAGQRRDPGERDGRPGEVGLFGSASAIWLVSFSA